MEQHKVMNKKLKMKFNSITQQLKEAEIFIKNCSLRLSRLKRGIKTAKLHENIWKNQLDGMPGERSRIILEVRHNFQCPASTRIQHERAMLVKLIRGEEEQVEGGNDEAEGMLKYLIDDLYDEEDGEGEREKLLLDIFELSGMAAITEMREAFKNVAGNN